MLTELLTPDMPTGINYEPQAKSKCKVKVKEANGNSASLRGLFLDGTLCMFYIATQKNTLHSQEAHVSTLLFFILAIMPMQFMFVINPHVENTTTKYNVSGRQFAPLYFYHYSPVIMMHPR